ncbi:unnamed protein product [Coregonus sp. 'balchen']|nr:unnamed protein product [Coregonus sp. 'balchen']
MLQVGLKIRAVMGRMTALQLNMCDSMFHNEELMDILRQWKFNALLSDPMMPCSDLMADALNIPLIISLRFTFGMAFERHRCQLPATPSFEFVQSSGDDGIVVFSLGSMVKNQTKERGSTIATALGKIPQKVLWRYSGEKPETLAPNTRVYDWIPQNDLLGHPKTKAFITHGGTNGLYESIYHGLPMVGTPLFADQPSNIIQMKNKRAAVMVDFNKITCKYLVDGLNSVIHAPS